MHEAEGLDPLPHGGVPTLHYAGHGQLWSRYPAGKAHMTTDASIRQQNAYLMAALSRAGCRRKNPRAQVTGCSIR